MSAAPSLLEENNITYEEAMDFVNSQSQFYNPFTHKKVVHRWRTEWVPKDQPVALTPGYNLEEYNPYLVRNSAPVGDLEPLDAEVVKSLLASLNEVAEFCPETKQEENSAEDLELEVASTPGSENK